MVAKEPSGQGGRGHEGAAQARSQGGWRGRSEQGYEGARHGCGGAAVTAASDG